MSVKREYQGWDFTWDGKPPETIQNDRRWLESIIRNAAAFSDWWTKTRIVQLAYSLPPHTKPQKLYGLPIYGGPKSEATIAQVLRDCCPNLEEYPGFARELNEDYVIETLNCWKSQQFSQAIGRNFEVYADKEHNNVFLVTSTAHVSLEVDRVLPPSDRFRPLFNVNEMAQIVGDRNAKRLTLRTHGYSNPAAGFYKSFWTEAEELNYPNPETSARTLQDDHFYVGYHWPSEQPITSPSLWQDYSHNPGILLKFLFILSSISGIVGALLYAFLKLVAVPLLQMLRVIPLIGQFWDWSHFTATAALAVTWYWLTPTLFLLWSLAFLLLRIVVYQRDRYRAIHYGAPDLAEFFWRLDKAMTQQRSSQQLIINLVGHSMGGLLLVNLLRILSDRFGKDDDGTLKPDSELVNLPRILPNGNKAQDSLPPNSGSTSNDDLIDDMGAHLLLDKLILASPDIPLEFLREGRNNYVRSAMRRCRRIYLFSSDRDIVLRYLSTIGNWFTEPSMQMSGLRLGNLYLKQMPQGADSLYRPYIRIMIQSERAVQPTSSYELFRKFNYLDCSNMRGEKGDGGVNAVPFPLSHLTALPIDLLNTLVFMLGVNHLDLHGGYFQTQTRSFQLIKLLLTVDLMEDERLQAEIRQLIKGTPIRFMPSQPWVMPKTTQPS
jgi:hypothetical protein